jgi:hypothetical protein
MTDAITSPSGVALGPMDESADTEREQLGDAGSLDDGRAATASSGRHRRPTVVSPIPSLLAATMDGRRRPEKAKVPVASLEQRLSPAKASFSAGDVRRAYEDAEPVVGEVAESGELSSPAFRREGPFLMQIYAAYLGNLDAAPVLIVPPEVWESQHPSAEARAVLARVNGLRTLRDILRDTGLDAFTQLRTAAQLFASGHIGWS